jgi:peptidylprolyl isomerase
MAKKGDMVVVHYQGTLNDGKVFDSSEGRDPLQFILGSGSMIPGFEKAIYDMKPGETKTVTIPAKQAYGPVRKDLIMEIPRNRLPEGLSPSVGDRLQMPTSKGGTAVVKVIKTTDTSITIDANHELAGQDLTFKIKLVQARGR